MTGTSMECVDIFEACCNAIASRALIRRTSSRDKEFHFQDWFRERLAGLALHFEEGGRISYPDFRLVHRAEGYEIKGLAYPDREASYDANSQLPSGHHNGRTMYYVFGRYPAQVIEDEFPVVDLVVFHGDLLNAHHNYVHRNRSFRSFGSYGDIMVRDRKMYVAPTPFALVKGLVGEQTLILPEGASVDERLETVGDLSRFEAGELVVGYHFDLTSNVLTPTTAPNPTSGKEHRFTAYRLKGRGGATVTMNDRIDPVEINEENGTDA